MTAMDNSIDQQFIEFIVKSLVGKPDAVSIARSIDEKGVLLELTVDPEDLGRVIGKRGATAQSLRTLLRALGTKNDARYNLKIIDNGVAPPRRDDAGSQSDGNWGSDNSNNSDDAAATGSSDESSSTPMSDPVDDSTPSSDEDDHSSVVSKTRKELEDLDDLDV